MPDRGVAIIGAGIGGLAAAIDLAATGHRVTVIERQATPGGKVRQVQAGPALIDAGPTVFTMRWVFEELFSRAGARLTDYLLLEPARVLARHAWDGVNRLDLLADLNQSADAIFQFAGAADARAFREFSAHAKRIYTTLEGPFLRAPLPSPASLVRAAGVADMLRINPFATLAGTLAKQFKDPRLRQLFGRYATYSGSSPYLCPATLMLIAHVEQDGVWLVQGGMINVALALADLALSLGVTFRYSEHVTRIDAADGRATGLILEGGERIAADAIILNADPAALTALRFGPDAARAIAPPDAGKRSLSAITLALHARADGFPLVRHNVFFQPEYAAEFTDIFSARRLPRTPTVYLCAQDRMNNPEDEALTDAPERLFVLINAPATGDTKPPTETEIEACTQQAFSHLLRCGLHVDRTTVAGVMTGPAQFNTLFPASGGALYGQAVHGSLATFKRPGSRTKIPNLYLAGGSTHPGAGVPMAALSGRLAAQALISDGPSTSLSRAQGYAWWYIDALSDDGAHGLTLIAFIGSVFSPWYKLARRGGAADPRNHCCMNVALYGKGGKRWAMTERGAASLERDSQNLMIGPSSLHWNGSTLVAYIQETTAPVPRKLRGKITLHPRATATHEVALDAAGRHRWGPIFPGARIEVAMSQPALSWSGTAYVDTNAGSAPLEDAFSEWNWCRAPFPDGSMAVLYHGTEVSGVPFVTALRYAADGTVEKIEPPPRREMKPGFWGVARATLADGRVAVVQSLEDAPFYTRSVITTHLLGREVIAVHESLSLPRFVRPWVQMMLPFKAPRRVLF